MKTESHRQQEKIKSEREQLGVSPVRLHHVPNWFRLKLLANWRELCSEGFAGCAFHFETDGWSVVHRALSEVNWLDHTGSTKLEDGRIAFVSEPYRSIESVTAEVERVAEILECDCKISEISWHYPGRTIRILFMESRE